MGRYKLSANGGYYDPNDSGPDQFTPTPGQQVPGMPQQPAQQPQTQPGGIDPNAPPGTYKPWSESMPDMNGGYYNPGGHYDQHGNKLPDPPPLDTSGWAHKQYPGGVGGPMTPMPEMPTWGGGESQLPTWGGGESQLPTWGGGESQLPTWGGGESQLPTWGGGESQLPQWPWAGQQNQTSYKPLSALGGIFGQSGGNVAPKAPGGIAGAVFNKYPGLFTK